MHGEWLASPFHQSHQQIDHQHVGSSLQCLDWELSFFYSDKLILEKDKYLSITVFMNYVQSNM